MRTIRFSKLNLRVTHHREVVGGGGHFWNGMDRLNLSRCVGLLLGISGGLLRFVQALLEILDRFLIPLMYLLVLSDRFLILVMCLFELVQPLTLLVDSLL